MSRLHAQYLPIANDNAPSAHRPMGDAVGFNQLLRERQYYREALTRAPLELSQTSEISAPYQWVPKIALACLLLSLTASLYSIFMELSAINTIVSFAALAWSGLWMAYLYEETHHPRISAIAVLFASLGGLGIWVISSHKFGLPLTPADGACLFACVSLLVALFTRSRMAIIISACCSLIWLVCFFQFGTINIIPLKFLPVLVIIQMIFAARYKAPTATLTVSVAGYFWLAWQAFTLNQLDDMSAIHSLTAISLIGFAHYRIGKALGDSKVHHANMHVILGWSVAILAALALQYFWLGNDADILAHTRLSPSQNLAWSTVSYGILAMIFCATAARWLSGNGSALGTLIAMTAAAFLFYTANAPDISSRLWFDATGLAAKPAFGLILTGVITASAVGMVINGFRLGVKSMALIGFATIAYLVYQITNPVFWNQDALMLGSVSFLISLCCIGLMVSDSQDNKVSKQPSRRYSHG